MPITEQGFTHRINTPLFKNSRSDDYLQVSGDVHKPFRAADHAADHTDKAKA